MSGRDSPFFELFDDPACIVAVGDGAFQQVNAAWTETFGWTLDALGAQKLPGLIHADDQPDFAAVVEAARLTSLPQRIENRARTADGSFLACEWKLRCEGDALFVVGHRLEPASPNQKLLASAFGAVGDGLCWVGRDGKIVEVNDRYADLVGALREELIGSFPPHAAGDPADRAVLMDIATAALSGESRQAELDLALADQSRSLVAVTGCPAPSATGPSDHALIAVRDLTRERLAEQAIREAHGWLAHAAAAADSALWVANTLGEAEWVDQALAHRAGLTQEALIGKTLDALVPVDRRGQVRSAVDGARRTMTPRDIDTRLNAAEGTETSATMKIHPFEDSRGRYGGFVALIGDARAAPGDTGMRGPNDLIDLLGAAVVTLDRDMRITCWNAAAQRIYGYRATETIGRPMFDVFTSDEGSPEMVALRRGLADEGAWQGSLTTVGKNGALVRAYLQATTFSEPRGAVSTVVVSMDMSLQHEKEERLGDARGYLSAVAGSMTDGLVAIAPNGRLAYMNNSAEKLLGWKLSELKGRDLHGAVQFQRADGSGYPAHESAIVLASRRSQAISIDEDVFTRRDGSMLWVEYTASPIRTGASSRGTVVIFRDIAERRSERQRVEQELESLNWVSRVRQALDQDRLVLYAQPIIDIASGETVQHELLLRMLLDGEVIPPGKFLPHAEKHGLIVDVDRWVIRQAVKLAGEGARVELNLSAKSLGDPSIVAEIDRELTTTGADPANLVFEVTETALMEDEVNAIEFAKAINGLGCGLALDDFGTGYGGFTYLKRL
ncbi:MAG: hypothetical protein QOJ07_2113, partial [Thermoleophilaceae bacterium]|nr:hypothetical protein [Thermoleophilaceae bacterium]